MAQENKFTFGFYNSKLDHLVDLRIELNSLKSLRHLHPPPKKKLAQDVNNQLQDIVCALTA